MRDVEYGQAQRAVHLLEVCDDVELDRLVERGERLVEQEQPRLRGERARQRDALRLAAGDGARASARGVPHVEAFEQRQRPLAPLAPRRAADRELDVLQRRHVREEREVLEDVADAPAAYGYVNAARRVEERLSVNRDEALIGADEPRDGF